MQSCSALNPEEALRATKEAVERAQRGTGHETARKNKNKNKNKERKEEDNAANASAPGHKSQ